MAKFDSNSAKTQLEAISRAEIQHVLVRFFSQVNEGFDELMKFLESMPEYAEKSEDTEKSKDTKNKAYDKWQTEAVKKFDVSFKRLKNESESRLSQGDFSPEIQLFGRFMTSDDFLPQ